jgi:AraC family transcriptional regulator, transcriptional activator of pobA
MASLALSRVRHFDFGRGLREDANSTSSWYFSDMDARSAPIPSFTLYGDPEQPDAVALMHIETIAARSVLNDWEIDLHRHNQSLQVLLVQTGRVLAHAGADELAIEAPCFVCVPQGAVHGFRFEPGTAGYVVTLSADFLARTGEADPLQFLLTEGGHGTLSEDAMRRMAWLAGELLCLSSGWPLDHRKAACLFEALLRFLPVDRAGLPLDPRLTEFRRLLERHLLEHRPVSFYAEQVGLSQRSLARLCWRYFGCTPQQAINRRMAAEAQRMLRHTNASVVQTSDALGFKDPSYFSRFYARETGTRPAREKNLARAS